MSNRLLWVIAILGLALSASEITFSMMDYQLHSAWFPAGRIGSMVCSIALIIISVRSIRQNRDE